MKGGGWKRARGRWREERREGGRTVDRVERGWLVETGGWMEEWKGIRRAEEGWRMEGER